MSFLLLILDGLGDLPVKGKTPLSAARTPNLDRLARQGIAGLFYSVSRGIVPGSDTSHLSMFGYPPEESYPGRGPLEALGVGLELKKGDIALRCNLATEKGGKLVDRRAGRIEKGADELFRSIDGMRIDGVEIIAKHSSQHRGALVLRGKGLSAKIHETDTHGLENQNFLRCTPLDRTDSALKTAQVLTKFLKRSSEILSDHPLNKGRKLPANIILTRGPGQFQPVQPIEERYGLKSASVAGGALYKGVSRYVGMETPDIAGATGTFDTDLEAKVRYASDFLQDHDFVFLHIKAIDNASHDGNFSKKCQMIGKVDKLIPKLPKEGHIAVTGDHSTPVAKRRHSSDPTPFILSGPNIRTDKTTVFSEIEAFSGGLGHFEGKHLIPMILDLLDKSHVYGA